MILIGLGELFAGSGGIKCSKCERRVWHVYLTNTEFDSIPKELEDRRLFVIENKLGVALCDDHRLELSNVDGKLVCDHGMPHNVYCAACDEEVYL